MESGWSFRGLRSSSGDCVSSARPCCTGNCVLGLRAAFTWLIRSQRHGRPAPCPHRAAFLHSGAFGEGRGDGRRREEGGACLFGRARHLGHPQMAPGDLSLRGGDVYRRSRPGRGARTGPQEGRAGRGARDLYRRSARGVRARLRVSDVPRQRALRGLLPARHVDRAAADRQAPDRDRARDRGRRGEPRRDGQGQRPGALRTRLLRLRARHHGDRAVARMGPGVAQQADRLRGEASDPDRARQARRAALLGRCQPAAYLLRGGARWRIPGSSPTRRCSSAPSPRRPRRTRHKPSRSISSAAIRSRSTARGSRRPPSCNASTSSAARTGSAASIWSRTAMSA